MKSVVITGGTRGIGYGIAANCLRRGCSVVITGRTDRTIVEAIGKLSKITTRARVEGFPCDVTEYRQVAALWDRAASAFGNIDIWVNNAGLGQPQRRLADCDEKLIASLTDTNVKGALFGCAVASAGMLKQGCGAIYNMEGFGSNGMRLKGMTLYGSSKYALSYITDSLALELRGSPIIVCGLRPGMTATDLITKPYENNPAEWKKVERIFNILSDRVETVTPWLVAVMLANTKNGKHFTWLTRRKLALRFLMSPFIKRKIY
ncbi:MAG: SDR family oxidoreductase [Chitinivibrionales bacterium]|nr:SDR family oxidoreductase [Chitinivibrionales bacterium]